MNPRITGNLRMEDGVIIYADVYVDGTFFRTITVYNGKNSHIAHDIMSGEIELLPGSSIAVECQHSENP